MKTFYCDRCGNLVFFENVKCLKCGGTLGYLPDLMDLATLEPTAGNKWKPLNPSHSGAEYRQCANGSQHQVCNWMVNNDNSRELCEACRLNQVIPDLSIAGHQERWHKLEVAKRRLLYTLKHLGLLTGKAPNKISLRFSFLAAQPVGAPVLTGHSEGLITINVAEADDVYREQQRAALKEPYRTLLGHLRHEVAHFYWDILVANSPRLASFRELFGDESSDYSAALGAYYQQGAAPNWPEQHVSAYASAHPWEDWAETFAHYLHIQDMLETAAGFGISLKPRHPAAQAMTSEPKKVDPIKDTFDRIVSAWVPLTYALNEVNRGMGLPDVYPFVLSGRAVAKLRFIHEAVQDFSK